MMEKKGGCHVNKVVQDLLNAGKIRKHHTFNETGICFADLKKVSGSAGIDVDNCYIYPDGKIEVCTAYNVHYGDAHFGEDGQLYDNRNRSIFKIAYQESH